MKPTSVIFLIVAVLIICLGVLLCITGNSMATDMGVSIFAQTGDSENNFSTTETFESEELKKVVLNFTDVNVNVYGGAEEEKEELVEIVEFLKSPKTEFAYVNEFLQSIALVHPEISFELKFNGKTTFKTTAQNDQSI